MKPKIFVFLITIVILFQGCNSYQYIYDSDSQERQRELQKNRSGNVAGEIFSFLGAVILEASTGVYVDYVPEEQEFKRFNLMNPTKDTMYVNMLSDLSWDNENYCDFMDIRIPPNDNCRILLPLFANYNIYFGISDNPEEDQLLEINTSYKRKITLIPEIETDSTKVAIKNIESQNSDN
ncbi:MAG: hypothetical protein HQ541_17130 [Mariniphaga sp.]|nr:hypothetical protein [Mariniphaga sp.]